MMCVRDIPELVSQGFMSVFKLIHIGCSSDPSPRSTYIMHIYIIIYAIVLYNIYLCYINAIHHM